MPDKVPSHPQPSAQAATSAFVRRALRNGALGLDSGNDAICVCLDHYATDNHFSQGCMQRLVVEDEVQLADIFEESIKGLHIYLDQVDQGEGGLSRR